MNHRVEGLRGFLAVAVLALLFYTIIAYVAVDVRYFSGPISYIDIPGGERIASVRTGIAMDGIPMDLNLGPSRDGYWTVVIGDWPKEGVLARVNRAMIWTTNSVGPRFTLTVWQNIASSYIRKK